MSLWITTPREADDGFPDPGSDRAGQRGHANPCLWFCLWAGLIGLIVGLILGQVGAGLHPGHSRIPWPAPVVPHPRSLPP
jgi:hypothetical protein